ncbi:MAG: NfeD family protein [Phycisphaerales bacterium]
MIGGAMHASVRLGSVAATTLLAQVAPGGGDSLLLWGFLLAAAALVLFAIELFVPSGGLLALLCAVCVAASVGLFFLHDPATGLLAVIGYCILAPVALIVGVRMWSHSPLAKRLILGGTDDEDDDLDAEEAVARSEQARAERMAALRPLIGTEGRTATPLRPVGFVVIDGRRIDALAEGNIIDADTRVIVVDIVDNQLKVRPMA